MEQFYLSTSLLDCGWYVDVIRCSTPLVYAVVLIPGLQIHSLIVYLDFNTFTTKNKFV